MPSNLKVVGEVELPEPSPAPAAAPVVEAKTERPSAPLSALSPHTIAVLEEIRRVLNARAGALLAMAGAFLLTGAAMWTGTWTALGVSLSYDVLVFIPIALIAYMRPKG